MRRHRALMSPKSTGRGEARFYVVSSGRAQPLAFDTDFLAAGPANLAVAEGPESIVRLTTS